MSTTTPIASALLTQVGGDHYKTMTIQPMTYIHANGLAWAEGTVVQYVSRWNVKRDIEDLRKARHVLDMLIELEDAVQKHANPVPKTYYVPKYNPPSVVATTPLPNSYAPASTAFSELPSILDEIVNNKEDEAKS